MEINNLLESANGYKTLQEDAKRLADKWGASGLLEGLDSKESNNMAIMLENQAKQIVAEQSSTGTNAIGAAGGGSEQWAGVALPLVRKVFAQISSKDFVSVQPMNLPSGLVFYLDFKYGTAGHGKTNDSSIYGNAQSDVTKVGVDAAIDGGLYGGGSFGYTIATGSQALSTQSTGSADSASVDFNAELDPADFKTVTVATSSLSGLDAEGVRAFRLISQSVDITDYPEYTEIDGGNVVFVVAATKVSEGFNGSVTFHKQPADNSSCAEAGDRARFMRRQRLLHFHCLEYDDEVAFVHGVTFRHLHLDDGSLHRGGHSVSGGS
jgi:hypothetical protein